MPDWLGIHEPVLVNTIGHCAGVVVFGMLLYFLLVNRRRSREGRSALPVVAAALAMFWNAGSLIALGAGPAGGTWADVIVAASFSVLSLLPAVLLDISLESRHRALWGAGYVLSAVAIVLHWSDLFMRAPRVHYAALLLVVLGFGALTVISVFAELRRRNRAAGSRLAGAMGLFLFAISFAHFGAEPARPAWLMEIVLHHAGLPLALLVLLQDYRFLLLDAFLRFIVNATLGAAAVLAAIGVLRSGRLRLYLTHPFDAGLVFVAAGLLLTLFVYLRNRMQSLLTRAIFLRSNVDEPLRELHALSRAAAGEAEYLRGAGQILARFLRACRCEAAAQPPRSGAPVTVPATILDSADWNLPVWVHAVAPVRFSRGDAAYLLLGAREGGRRYLSEDLQVLARLGAAVAEHIEQLRGVQLQNLVTQAELRALQAQINPHFLFNALNTLYGTIDRTNVKARRLVLDLSEVFRHLLRAERTFIEVEEEVRIVRAYLEIEELRLGPKLRTEVDIDPSALHGLIPLLSIQPLVENAVKHGVASKMGTGFVRLRVRSDSDTLVVEVSNSGQCDPRALAESSGIGLTNVRRRLALCYGSGARLDVQATQGVTTVGFVLPARPVPAVAAAI